MTSPFGAPQSASPAPAGSPFGAPATPAATAPQLPDNIRALFGSGPMQQPRGGDIPKMRDLYGWPVGSNTPLIIYKVTAYESGRPGVNQGEVQDRATVDVGILDGSPFGYGGNPGKGYPHTKTWDPANPPEPGWIKGMYISQRALVKVMLAVWTDKRNGTGSGIALGRLYTEKATQIGQNDTFLITTNVPDPNDPTGQRIIRPAFTDAEAATASAWLQRYPRFIDGL